MSLAQRFDLLVFDFDGTLCDSTRVKTEAYRLLYLDEHGPDFADRVRTYHLANAGVSRYEKIQHIETEMLGSPPSEERIDQIATRFGSIVEQQVIAAPLFAGVIEFLEHHQVPFAVASATPTDELRRITSAKGMDGYFVAIEGSPRTKGEILSDYVERYAPTRAKVLMVGDQPSDVAAAVQAGTEFFAIVAGGESADWATPFPVVPNFNAFASAIVDDHTAWERSAT